MVKPSPPATMVPVRLAPAFGATVNSTLPLPLPLAPDVIVIQEAPVTAVQEQLLPDAVTANEPAPPPAGTVAPVGFNVYVQVGRIACWFTVNVWPAMVIVSERAAPTFGSTRNPTDPLPFPLAALVNEIQDADSVAVHAHAAGAVTPIEPVPPTADSDALVALS